MFYLNVPIGIVTIIVFALIRANDRSAQGAVSEARPAFDWAGAALSGMALLLFLLMVGNGDRFGWSSP